MVVSRQRIVRVYHANFPNWSLVELEGLLDQYATFGIVSTEKEWAFLRYYKMNGAWHAESSLNMPVTLASVTDRALLAEQVKPILRMLCDSMYAQIEYATQMEDLIVKRGKVLD